MVQEASGLYIGQFGWLVYANAPGTPLACPVIAFVTAETPYGFRFDEISNHALSVSSPSIVPHCGDILRTFFGDP